MVLRASSASRPNHGPRAQAACAKRKEAKKKTLFPVIFPCTRTLSLDLATCDARGFSNDLRLTHLIYDPHIFFRIFEILKSMESRYACFFLGNSGFVFPYHTLLSLKLRLLRMSSMNEVAWMKISHDRPVSRLVHQPSVDYAFKASPISFLPGLDGGSNSWWRRRASIRLGIWYDRARASSMIHRAKLQ